MILTGNEIAKQVKLGNITISPFVKEQVNPNSYNYRINDVLINLEKNKIIKIPKTGYVLKPHTAYLASTYETLGSSKYAMSLIGRSSMGRLGLFLQLSANIGHTGACHKWTLELVCAKPFKIYPRMIIGQMSFWTNMGKVKKYTESYSKYDAPKLSKLERFYDFNRKWNNKTD